MNIKNILTHNEFAALDTLYDNATPDDDEVTGRLLMIRNKLVYINMLRCEALNTIDELASIYHTEAVESREINKLKKKITTYYKLKRANREDKI
jgi:hypothetical protein